ncbi:MAG: hypothetical protein KAR05_10120 [Candidatus Omnitrophica bacterium]|nr:hypothetical protein [Candidatus Omnitrophota bacterium]
MKLKKFIIFVFVACFSAGLSFHSQDALAQKNLDYLNNNYEMLPMPLTRKKSDEVPYHILISFYNQHDIYWDDAPVNTKIKFVAKYNREMIKKKNAIRKIVNKKRQHEIKLQLEAKKKQLDRLRRERKSMQEKLKKKRDLTKLKNERERKRKELKTRLKNRETTNR